MAYTNEEFDNLLNRIGRLEQTVHDAGELLKMSIVFLVGETRNGDRVTVERRNESLWVVKCSGFVQNKDNEWELEGLPTNRTDEFIKNTRFDFRTAMLRAEEIIKTLGTQMDPPRRPETVI